MILQAKGTEWAKTCRREPGRSDANRCDANRCFIQLPLAFPGEKMTFY